MIPANSVHIERHRSATLYLCDGVNAQDVLKALNTPGEMLRRSKKRDVRRVGDWVVKSTRMNQGIGPLKVTVNRNRYRNAWISSLAMEKKKLPVPKTIAYVEHQRFGIIWRSTFIFEYMKDCMHALDYVTTLKAQNDPIAIDEFLEHVAQALFLLEKADINHRDLKLCNLLTQDGKTFYFIDLDEAYINQPFKPEFRMRNHMQIANSLRTNGWEKGVINSFLQRTIPVAEDQTAWFLKVWKAIDAPDEVVT